MRRRWLLGPLLGLALLCVLAATAPARLLPGFLPTGQLVLQGLDGTLWHGGASRALLAVPGGYLNLGRVEWTLHPLSLLLLSPSLDLDAAWGRQTLRGALRVSASGDVDVEGMEGRFDAALLAQFVPVRLVGDFSAQLAELQLRDGQPRAVEGRVLWERGGWNSPQGVRPLGTYAVDLHTGDDGTLRGEVVTVSGEVAAAGEVRWQGGRYAVDILLSGPGLEDPQLRQALQLVAAPEGENFRLKLEGGL